MIQDALNELLEGRDPRPRQGARGDGHDHVGRGDARADRRFLVALRLKGETAEEITGCAEAMRAHVLPVKAKRDDLVDTAGTGGDGGKTFNISTARRTRRGGRRRRAWRSTATARCRHSRARPTCSSRSASSSSCRRSGSRSRSTSWASASCSRRHIIVDEARGPSSARARRAHRLQRARPADEHRGRARTRSSACTYSPLLVPVIADVLAALGARHAFVVHGAGGIDELSPAGPNLSTRSPRVR